MAFESTLEKKDKEHAKHLKKAIENGYKNPTLDKVFALVSSSSMAVNCLQERAVVIAKTVQPSILDKDLQIAGNMMCAMATQLVLNLVNEGLIKIKE